MNTTNIKQNGQQISNPNDRETYDRYLKEISKYRPLTREHELELFKRLEAGDDSVIDTICKHNLLFVVSIAKRYSALIGKSRLTLEDLINDGNYGLISAIPRFDYKTGNKFISYAVWWIKQGILASIGNNIKNIRIPNNVTSIITKLKKQESLLEQKLSRDVTTLELFESMVEEGILDENANNRIDEYYKMSGYETSLSNTITDDGIVELSERLKSEELPPDETLINKERNELIMDLIKNIPNQIKEYFFDYFGINGRIPLSLKEMGVKYEVNGVTIKSRMDKYLRQIRSKNRKSRTFFYPSIGHDLIMVNDTPIVKKVPYVNPIMVDYIPQTVSERKAAKKIERDIKNIKKAHRLEFIEDRLNETWIRLGYIN